MNFDLSDLRAFVASADFGSFRAAADSLHLSPSALSRRVEKLESALGVKLFERTTRRMELTVAGRAFIDKARNVLTELESSLFGMEDLGRRLTGLVTIACVPSAVSFFLPDTVKRYHHAYPGIRVRLIDENSSVVFLSVARGEADFGLTYIGTQEPDIEFTPILQDPFVLACQRDHPLARKRSVSWAELAEQPDYMLLAQGSGNRTLIDHALASSVRQPNWVLRGAARAGAGEHDRGGARHRHRAQAGAAARPSSRAGQRAGDRAGRGSHARRDPPQEPAAGGGRAALLRHAGASARSAASPRQTPPGSLKTSAARAGAAGFDSRVSRINRTKKCVCHGNRLGHIMNGTGAAHRGAARHSDSRSRRRRIP